MTPRLVVLCPDIAPKATRGPYIVRPRLTDEQCAEIRKLKAEGLRYAEIARRFGASFWTVRNIADGITRKGAA